MTMSNGNSNSMSMSTEMQTAGKCDRVKIHNEIVDTANRVS